VSFAPLGIGADGQRAVPQHPQRRPTFRGDVAAPPSSPIRRRGVVPPECDRSRIPIRIVSRRAIEAMVANFNRNAVHAD